MAPSRGSHVFHRLIWGKHKKKFLSETTGVKLAYIKSTFSEYGHVAYQIKVNEAYNNMLENNFTLTLTFDPWGGVKRLICFLFCK